MSRARRALMAAAFVRRALAEAPAWRAAALLALALLLPACGPRDVQQPTALPGRWEGHVAWHDATTPIVLEVVPSEDSLAAMFSAPALGVEEVPIGRFAFAPPRVHFRVHDATGTYVFDGWLRRGLVVGAFSSPVLGDERNPSRLPQLSLRQHPAAHKRSPFPAAAGVDSVPPPTPAPERSFGAWLLAHRGR